MAIDPITAAFSAGKLLIEKIWPDPSKQAEELRKLEEMRQSGNLEAMNAMVKLLTSQMDVNKQEAQHRSIFVAGWRPAVGWVCAVGVLWAFVGYPIAGVVNAYLDAPVVLPDVPTDNLFELLFGMLGLGGLRTFEKLKGLTK